MSNSNLNSILASLGGDVATTKIEEVEELTDISAHDETNEFAFSPLEKKALSLLGSGCNNEVVASALGVTPSTISGMLAQKYFRDKVTELRYKSLQRHNDRDLEYDKLEDSLLVKLKASLPMMIAPKTIMEAIKVVNGAKRRGSSAPQAIAQQAQVTQLILPNAIVQQFTVNSNNQVIQAGNQTLITMESTNLDKLVEAKRSKEFIESSDAAKLIGDNSHDNINRST